MDVKIVEYTKTAAALGELRQRYENVIFPVSTTAGMKDVTAARKELRDIRVGMEKMRKDIKAQALERQRAELEADQKAAQAKGQETTAEPAPVEPEPVAARITAMGYDIACATDAIAEHLIAVKGESLPPEAVSEVARPSDEEIIDVVAKHYGVSPSTAHGWLADFNAPAVIGRLVEAA